MQKEVLIHRPDGSTYSEIWDVEPEPERTSAEHREHAYQTMKLKEDGSSLIQWEGKNLTVDQANDLWIKYMAEGSPKADELTSLIAAAKAYIRELYPVEE